MTPEVSTVAARYTFLFKKILLKSVFEVERQNIPSYSVLSCVRQITTNELNDLFSFVYLRLSMPRDGGET